MSSTTKIIFISGIKTEDSTGEYTQLRTFADELNKEIEYTIFLKRTDHFHFKNNDIIFYDNEYELRNYISSIEPQIIILSEIQHISKYFMDYLYSTNIIIATFDSIGLSKKLYNPDPKVIYLKSCPLNDPNANDKYNKYWFIAKNAVNINKKNIQEKYNINKESKNVFVSISKWQLAKALGQGYNDYYKFFIGTIMKALVMQDRNISLFLICPLQGTHNVIAEKQKLKTYFYESLENNEYNELLFNSDLVISDNISQISLSRAFVNGINCLSIINTNENNIMNIHKFNMFPYNVPELNELYNYEYCKNLEKAEVFDENEVFKKISLLLDKKINNNVEYVEKCNKLLNPNDLIKEIIEEH